ncbi:hypothetical protein WJX81_000891 [Elliptochloris bilobata]|uniref:Ketosynthase family 3 (KS3) domain-containing protein n=1 Tax=Elliptochloris bilobata TaxID=381761 RepID=A0AAW1QY01_9CHLO
MQREPAGSAVDVLGVACRFPESASAAAFWRNLAGGVDMLTADARRWPPGALGTPARCGKVPDSTRFDAGFFARMDPQLRMLLEVAHEAWVDAGVDPAALRGSDRVGVYVGACGSEAHQLWLSAADGVTGYEHTGCSASMFANRLSWTFDLRGPSKAIDTACSSSLTALRALARRVCASAGVAPDTVAYAEAHGTGTSAGDVQELAALDDVYGSGAGRMAHAPLLIGSVKSNMGHCEGCSGLAGLIKLMLAGEAGLLPGNLHFRAPNPASAGLASGALKVVAQNTAWPGGVAAISSFGFGGSNAHVLLRCPDAVAAPLLRYAMTQAADAARLAFRGTLTPEGGLLCARTSAVPPPVWFVFPGNGSQWPRMGADLLTASATFRASVAASAAAAAALGVDILPDCGRRRRQMGIVDVLREDYGIRPAGVLGHSAGEITCGYADGALTHEETIAVAFHRRHSPRTHAKS